MICNAASWCYAGVMLLRVMCKTVLTPASLSSQRTSHQEATVLNLRALIDAISGGSRARPGTDRVREYGEDRPLRIVRTALKSRPATVRFTTLQEVESDFHHS